MPIPQTNSPVSMLIEDETHQKQAWAEIVVWLDINETDSERGSLQFSSITIESFRDLFRRLVLMAHPTYEFSASQVQATGDWASEFETTLKALSYPFQIDLSWISKPSQVCAWPFLLWICEWLFKKGKARIGAPIDGWPALAPCLADVFPLEFEYDNGYEWHKYLSYGNYTLDLVKHSPVAFLG